MKLCTQFVHTTRTVHCNLLVMYLAKTGMEKASTIIKAVSQSLVLNILFLYLFHSEFVVLDTSEYTEI